MTNPVYLGVDVAGAKNTWACALSIEDDRLAVVHGPRLATLEEVVGYCERDNVVAAAIDAPLTIALSEENGFRTSDVELRAMLLERRGSRNWVAAQTSLMAVTVRGKLLADHLSPTVGTLVETHPRASLLFALGEEAAEPVRRYKGSADRAVREAHTRELWRLWSERFGIAHEEPVQDDGELDALVCATVAYLFHHEPGKLHRLRHDVAGKTGRGPFYVVAPTSEATAGKARAQRNQRP
jgi:predicted nuclease with RNAse H fold